MGLGMGWDEFFFGLCVAAWVCDVGFEEGLIFGYSSGKMWMGSIECYEPHSPTDLG
jgi:hypothetical protein